MQTIKCRSAKQGDLKLLYNWANDQSVRKNAIHTAPIILDQHIKWFTQKLQEPETIIYIFEQERSPIGQVRFEIKNQIAKIDYSLDASFRGKGLGKKILALAIQKLSNSYPSKVKQIIGEVRQTNIASIKIFEHLGFLMVDQRIISGYSYKVFSIQNENSNCQLQPNS